MTRTFSRVPANSAPGRLPLLPSAFKILFLFTSIAAVCGADKEQPKFDVRPVTEFKARQANGKVTVAAQVFISDEEAHAPFGKLNPYKYGILPVLVVIQNDGDHAVNLEQMKVEYTTAEHQRIFDTPAKDVRFVNGPDRPKTINGPTGPKPIRLKKNPLADWTIEGRAFAARMIPAHQAASGFFYFQTTFMRSASLVLTGMKDARTGEDLFYFEIPLAEAAQ